VTKRANFLLGAGTDLVYDRRHRHIKRGEGAMPGEMVSAQAVQVTDQVVCTAFLLVGV
jgi:hypothetical protein